MANLKPKLPQTPSGRPLAVFVGDWAMEVVFPDPDVSTLRGVASFTWLERDALLLLRSRVRGNGPPKSVSVIGADDFSKAFWMLYCDERGVSRHYEMTLSVRLWTLSRVAPGFHQRFIGRLTADGTTIRGEWEKSKDGRRWQHDFGVTYLRKGRRSRKKSTPTR
jgi:hypothetical protein